MQPALRAFVNAAPYTTALIELEGCQNTNGIPVRICGVMLDEEEHHAINAPVEVVFEDTAQADIVVPRFKKAGTAPTLWRLLDHS